MSTCRSCGAPVVWAVTASTGAMMPLDAQPVDPATRPVLAVHRQPDGTLMARSIPQAGELHLGERYGRSHFATCPQADTHRSTR